MSFRTPSILSHYLNTFVSSYPLDFIITKALDVECLHTQDLLALIGELLPSSFFQIC